MSDEFDERASKLVADLRNSGDGGEGNEGEEGAGNKGKKAKKVGKRRAWMVVVPILLVLIGGGVYAGLVLTKRVKSPFVAQKKTAAPVVAAAKTETEVAPAEDTTTPAPDPKEEADKAKKKADAAKKAKELADRVAAEAGAKKIAKAWETMDADALVKVAAGYNDVDLSRVLAKMDSEKVGAVLAALDPKRAAKVSRQIEQLAGQAAPTSS